MTTSKFKKFLTASEFKPQAIGSPQDSVTHVSGASDIIALTADIRDFQSLSISNQVDGKLQTPGGAQQHSGAQRTLALEVPMFSSPPLHSSDYKHASYNHVR